MTHTGTTFHMVARKIQIQTASAQTVQPTPVATPAKSQLVPGKETVPQAGTAAVGQPTESANGDLNIACTSFQLDFTAPSAGTAATGKNNSTSAMTCTRPVDQLGMKMAAAVTENQHIPKVTLTNASSFMISMDNVSVADCKFTGSGSQVMEEVTFRFQKIVFSFNGSQAAITINSIPIN
jgi:type VI protein secretion system component Hcp